MPYVKPKKHHYGPATGRVVCGRSTKAPRVKTREEWDALEKSQRCTLCDEHVQRGEKPRKFGATGVYGTFCPVRSAS